MSFRSSLFAPRSSPFTSSRWNSLEIQFETHRHCERQTETQRFLVIVVVLADRYLPILIREPDIPVVHHVEEVADERHSPPFRKLIGVRAAQIESGEEIR